MSTTSPEKVARLLALVKAIVENVEPQKLSFYAGSNFCLRGTDKVIAAMFVSVKKVLADGPITVNGYMYSIPATANGRIVLNKKAIADTNDASDEEIEAAIASAAAADLARQEFNAARNAAPIF